MLDTNPIDDNIVYCHNFFYSVLPVSMKKTGGEKCSGTWMIWLKEEIFSVLKFYVPETHIMYFIRRC
jgi:hypothetical protein